MLRVLMSAITAAVLIGPAAVHAQGRASSVMTDLVTEEQVSETIAVFGELVAGRQSRVAARIAGVADAVHVDVGDRVEDGDLLVEIDSDLLMIEVAQAEAALSVAQAAANTARTQVENARTAYRRAESLRENSIISDATYDERESALRVAEGTLAEAEARVATARVALERARYDLDNAKVRAPFAGVIVELGTEVGQFVALGTEVANLIDIDGMEVEANVPSRYIDALQPDQDVSARTDAGGAMVLKLRATLPTEFSATRTRPVIFEVVSKQGTAASGQSVTLNLPTSAPRNVAAVPKDALIQSRGGWQVFVAEDGKAQPRAVEIGIAIGDRYEVLSGLAPGDAVVVRGNERLRPGQDIAPSPVSQREGMGSSGTSPAGADGDGTRQQASVQNTD